MYANKRYLVIYGIRKKRWNNYRRVRSNVKTKSKFDKVKAPILDFQLNFRLRKKNV